MKAHLFLLTACLSLCAADLGVVTPRNGILLHTRTTRPDFKHFEVELKPADTTNVITLTITNILIEHGDLVQLPSGRIVMGLKTRFLDGSVSDLAIYTFDLRRAAPPAPSAELALLHAGSDEPKSLINELERIREAVPPPPMPARNAVADHAYHYYSTNIPNWRPTNITELMSRTNPVTWNPADYTNQEPDTRVWTDVLIRPFAVAESTNVATAVTFVTDPTLVTNLAYCWYRLAHNVNCQSTNHDHEVIDEPGSRFVPKPLPGATNQSYAQYLDWLADRKGKRRNE